MTQTLDPPTTAGADGPGGLQPPHPVVGFLASLSEALDRLSATATWSMTPTEQREALVALHRQRARLEELGLRVLVSADRNEVGAESGATSTATWMAEATGSSPADCFRDVHLAHALDQDFDATRRSLAGGEIDSERAGAVVRAVTALTDEHDDLPPGTRAAAEAHLLGLARVHDARTLRRLGKRLFEVVCPEAADEREGRTLAQEEERARRLASLTLHDNGDGTAEGRFRLPTLHARLLKRALESLTSPARTEERRQEPVAGTRPSYSTVLGRGLMELLERHLDVGSLPGSAGSPFTVVVTVNLEALQSGLGVAVLDTGDRMSAGQARRLACEAGLIPMVLGGESMPLDLGRERRLFSKHQRIALAQRFGGCAGLTCDRPPSQTEVHHLDPWHRGGRTDLARGIPLCSAHHEMADHPQTWQMTTRSDGRVRFSRRT